MSDALTELAAIATAVKTVCSQNAVQGEGLAENLLVAIPGGMPSDSIKYLLDQAKASREFEKQCDEFLKTLQPQNPSLKMG